MRRTLVLDEEDLLMVVKEDIVKQIDDNRGEMNRTEFVNYLIHCQLKEQLDKRDCISRNEFLEFANQMTGVLHSFLQFFISYGMAMGPGKGSADIQALNQKLESLNPFDEDQNKF